MPVASSDIDRELATTQNLQELVVRQQQVGAQLIRLAGAQRELAKAMDELGKSELASRAREIEGQIHSVAGAIIRLEENAIDDLTAAVESPGQRP